MKIIKGDWLKNSDAVFASQHEEFLFINTNGARWINQEPGDVSELLETLANHPLDVDRFGDAFIQPNPCRGVAVGNGKYVDGPRLFDVETTHFWGNFADVSHVFSIYTNSQPIIDALTQAIEANISQQRAAA